jgi:hypothetical protein
MFRVRALLTRVAAPALEKLAPPPSSQNGARQAGFQLEELEQRVAPAIWIYPEDEWVLNRLVMTIISRAWSCVGNISEQEETMTFRIRPLLLLTAAPAPEKRAPQPRPEGEVRPVALQIEALEAWIAPTIGHIDHG